MTTEVPEMTTFENVVVTTEVTKETEFGIRLLNVTGDSAIIVMTTNDDVITVTLLFMSDYLNEPIENRLTVFKRINNIKLSPLPPNSDFTMKAIFYLKDGSSMSKEVTFQSARVGPATTQQPTTFKDEPTTQVQMTDFDIRAANVTSDDAIVVVAVTDDVTKVSLTFYEDGVKVGSESVFRDLNPVSRIRLRPLMPGTSYKMVANFYFNDNRVRQKQAEFVTLGREGVETTPSTQESTTKSTTTEKLEPTTEREETTEATTTEATTTQSTKKQEPTTEKQEPTTKKQEPTTKKQQLTTKKQEPTTEREETTEATTTEATTTQS